MDFKKIFLLVFFSIILTMPALGISLGVNGRLPSNTSTFFASNSVSGNNKTVTPLNQQMYASANVFGSDSYIWAGYAIGRVDNYHPVSEIEANWYIPEVNCAITPNAQTSVWIGIDGDKNIDYGSTTVEQIGTDSICTNGNPTYNVWYDLYPSGAVFFDQYEFIPNANDFMYAQIARSGSYLNFFIEDVTQQGSGCPSNLPGSQTRQCEYSISISIDSTWRMTTGEWVVERPTVNGLITDLANFNTPVEFENCYATVLNTRYDLYGFWSITGDQVDEISMITFSGSWYLATLGTISNGMNFDVYWNAAN